MNQRKTMRSDAESAALNAYRKLRALTDALDDQLRRIDENPNLKEHQQVKERSKLLQKFTPRINHARKAVDRANEVIVKLNNQVTGELAETLLTKE